MNRVLLKDKLFVLILIWCLKHVGLFFSFLLSWLGKLIFTLLHNLDFQTGIHPDSESKEQCELWWLQRGGGVEGGRGGYGGINSDGWRLDFLGWWTQNEYTDDVLKNCASNTYIILLTQCHPKKFIKRKKIN